MNVFWIVQSLFSYKSMATKFLNHIEGEWNGYIAISDSINSPTQKLINASISFVQDESKLFSKVTLFKVSDSTQKKAKIEEIIGQYFLKKDIETNDTLYAITPEGDDYARFRMINTNDYYFFGRGLAFPKNDQFSISYEDLYLDIIFTDQFSNNITICRFIKKDSFNFSKVIFWCALLLTLIICFSYFIYKASDLSDIVSPEEGQYTRKVKAQSIYEDQIKQVQKNKQKED